MLQEDSQERQNQGRQDQELILQEDSQNRQDQEQMLQEDSQERQNQDRKRRAPESDRTSLRTRIMESDARFAVMQRSQYRCSDSSMCRTDEFLFRGAVENTSCSNGRLSDRCCAMGVRRFNINVERYVCTTAPTLQRPFRKTAARTRQKYKANVSTGMFLRSSSVLNHLVCDQIRPSIVPRRAFCRVEQRPAPRVHDRKSRNVLATAALPPCRDRDQGTCAPLFLRYARCSLALYHAPLRFIRFLESHHGVWRTQAGLLFRANLGTLPGVALLAIHAPAVASDGESGLLLPDRSSEADVSWCGFGFELGAIASRAPRPSSMQACDDALLSARCDLWYGVF